ncbi:uncharacterized protein J3R85_008260 [Psidium guajava]|nr:uncharacterized protein J3R85_008260 [Psidium guajava]
MEELKLHGFWASPYSHRVIWALKLKGVEYEYIEEDLSNKSQLLLQYNPVQKKIPVLVHHGKPIIESLIILEYIEETWSDPPLLPKDAHERASSRFWMNFMAEKSLSFFKLFLMPQGEEREKAIAEVLEVLRTIEHEALADKKYFGGDNLGLVDITFGWLAYWYECTEEAVGVKLLCPNTFPRLHSWVENWKEVDVVKENHPNPEKLLDHFRKLQERFA